MIAGAGSTGFQRQRILKGGRWEAVSVTQAKDGGNGIWGREERLRQSASSHDFGGWFIEVGNWLEEREGKGECCFTLALQERGHQARI